jgi:hypothetical protein
MKSILARDHDGCRSYATFDGELLFHGRVEPQNYWNSWFARVKRVEFSCESGTFAIDRFSLDQVMKISNGKGLFGELRYRGRKEIELRRADGAAFAAFSPQGLVTFNRTYECHAPGDMTLFKVRVPTFSEWIVALRQLNFKIVYFVGECDRESMKDPAIAILFMFTEMFLDRGRGE